MASMPPYVRWSIASIVCLIAGPLTGLWLEGDAATWASFLFGTGLIVTLIVAFFSWFRWTQREK
ncbi:hypothetical protein ACQBJO_02530 [Janibacter sp. G349]|uniref:hypothetical protein n=2 Tax=unclassified Janibacter TaxID=2649294 RepID=UPI003B76AD83